MVTLLLLLLLLLLVVLRRAQDGNLAGWHTPKPDKMWNYCALKDKCTSDGAHWGVFCTSCFRCKLGSTKQGAFQLESDDRGRQVAVRRVRGVAPRSRVQCSYVTLEWVSLNDCA